MINIAAKSDKKPGGGSDIGELRVYFNGLKTAQKKEFIQNLQKKLAGSTSAKYNEFLSECVTRYKNEVRAMNEASAKTTKSAPPDLSSDSFALALAMMLAAPKPEAMLASLLPKLIGTWQREFGGKKFYYKFNDDGTFETNTVQGHESLKGHFNIGLGNAVLMEPHELLQVENIMMSASGNSLTLVMTDGSAVDYRREG